MRVASPFTPLHAQVAAAIRARIADGTWASWLPGERALAEELRVSRKTLRKAVAQLRHDGVLRTALAQGHAILPPKSGALAACAARAAQVVFLSPVPLEQMRPFTVLWVDQLRSLLGERRVQLRLLAGEKYFSAQARGPLARLVAQQPADCWLLARSSETTQRWFQESGTPCVLAGSCHAGIDLPNVDLDHAALGRHAAGVLLSAGHRRIAMLMDHSARAGDTQTHAGFLRGVRSTRRCDVDFAVALHSAGPAGVRAVVRRLLARADAPTALFVSRSEDYLTVICTLGELRKQVGAEVSLLLRDDDPYLLSLLPVPNRYAFSHRVFAQRIGRLLAATLAEEAPAHRHVSVLPTYVNGGSVRVLRGPTG